MYIVCTIFEKELSDAKFLKSHMIIHHKKKDNYCIHCGKKFIAPSHLRRHEVIHFNVTPFQCPSCPGSFTQKANMKKHMEVHEESKSFPCPLCEKSFAEFGDLRKHDRTHTGVKPYNCNECGQFFSQLSNLKTHKKTKKACLVWKKHGKSKNGKQANMIFVRHKRDLEPSYLTSSMAKSQQMPTSKKRGIEKGDEDFLITDSEDLEVSLDEEPIERQEDMLALEFLIERSHAFITGKPALGLPVIAP